MVHQIVPSVGTRYLEWVDGGHLCIMCGAPDSQKGQGSTCTHADISTSVSYTRGQLKRCVLPSAKKHLTGKEHFLSALKTLAPTLLLKISNGNMKNEHILS